MLSNKFTKTTSDMSGCFGLIVFLVVFFFSFSFECESGAQIGRGAEMLPSEYASKRETSGKYCKCKWDGWFLSAMFFPLKDIHHSVLL